MNNTTKVPVKRGSDRRNGDRRQVDLPLAGRDRRVAERRVRSDRRA